MKSGSVLFIFRVGCFLLLSPFNNISAQNTVSVNSFYQQALANAKSVYHKSFRDQSALYNGSNGDYLFPFEKGYPYFYSIVPGIGSVVYDGINYDSIVMTYDEVKDALVIILGVKRLQLASEKVESFHLFNSDFIKINKDSLAENLVKSGFYNVLYKGKIWLLKKQVKIITEDLKTSQVLHMIDEQDYYYIKMDDKFYLVNSKKNLLKIFSDKKKEVQQFIRVNGLNFRNDRMHMLIETIAYYDSLKK